MSDQHEGPWANDVIYGKLLPHVKNMGYTDWVRLGDACAVMQQMRDSLQAQIAALSVPAPEQGELKPCPFCGGEAYLDAMNPPLHEIRCADCASCGQIKTNKDEAVAAWNRRTPPAPAVPAMPDEIAETIRCALNETAEDIGMNPAFYADPHEAMRKVEAALAWLAQQRAAPDEETA